MKISIFLILAACAALAQTAPQTSPQTGAQFQMPGWMSSQQSRTDAQTGPVQGKPFSGTETRHSTDTLADGSKTNTTETTAIYRDPEGRMRMESGTNVLIYDPVAHAFLHLNAEKKTFTRQEIAGDVASSKIIVTSHGTFTNNYLGKPQPMNNYEDLGVQTVNGISARGTRTIVTIPGSSIGADHDLKVVNERWYSDALGILVKSSNNDPRFGITTYDLTNLNQSTPNPALFTVPQGYTELQQFYKFQKAPKN